MDLVELGDLESLLCSIHKMDDLISHKTILKIYGI